MKLKLLTHFYTSSSNTVTSLCIVGNGKVGERQVREGVGVVGALGVVAVWHEAPGGRHGRREDGVEGRGGGEDGGDAGQQVDELLVPEKRTGGCMTVFFVNTFW